MDETTRKHVEKARADLAAEFDGRIPPEQVAAAFDEELQALSQARVPDFVPVLVLRAARERLLAGTR